MLIGEIASIVLTSILHCIRAQQQSFTFCIFLQHDGVSFATDQQDFILHMEVICVQRLNATAKDNIIFNKFTVNVIQYVLKVIE